MDVLKGLAGLVGDCRGACVIITGSGAAWMYAGVAALAAGGGAATVACLSPRDASAGLIVVYGQETPPGSRLAIPAGVLPELSEPGQVIGIVGDPNSGKSVLAKLCLHALRQSGSRDCWCLDCDAASPTPNWYVDMTQAGAALRAKDLRDKQKRPWNREMELAVAEQLRSCRGMLQLVIADLPGGRHTGDVKQRIPENRDVIMREVDRFIVLGREGAPEVIEGWRRELEKHGLADRIVAELRSAEPGAAFSLALDAEPRGGVLRGRVTGLDRGNASAGASAEFLAGLRELLRHAGAV
ncbi:MAG: hypothetical protein GX595_12115 [Lentisphaerae bacterium]|nr:hypothetical protein [Lentisphaerota bacterium]